MTDQRRVALLEEYGEVSNNFRLLTDPIQTPNSFASSYNRDWCAEQAFCERRGFCNPSIWTRDNDCTRYVQREK